MDTVRLARAASLLALAALAGACSSDSPTSTSSSSLDLAEVLGQMTVPAPPAGVGVALLSASMPPLPAVSTAGCTYTASSGDWVCPQVTGSGLTMTRSFTLLDEQGRPQAVADKATVAAVRMVTRVTGKITHAGPAPSFGTTTVDDRQELTLSGLLRGTRTLDGSGITLLTMTSPAGTVTSTVTKTITGLALPAPGSATRWPTAGTVTIDGVTDVGAPDGIDPSMHVELVFTPGGQMRVAFTTVAGVTQHCIVNLAAGTSTCGG